MHISMVYVYTFAYGMYIGLDTNMVHTHVYSIRLSQSLEGATCAALSGAGKAVQQFEWGLSQFYGILGPSIHIFVGCTDTTLHSGFCPCKPQ